MLGGGRVDLAANSTRDVRAVNFISWLERATSLRPRSSVVVRMDAEGMEYHLLPALAASGLGLRLRAQGRRLVLVVEWHRAKRDAALAEWARLQGGAIASDFLACFRTRSPWFSCTQPLARAGVVLLKDTPGSAGSSANLLFGGGADPGGAAARAELAERLTNLHERLLNNSLPPRVSLEIATEQLARKHYPRVSAAEVARLSNGWLSAASESGSQSRE